MPKRLFLAAIVLIGNLAHGAPKVDVRVQGVSAELEQNVLAHLSIVRDHSQSKFDITSKNAKPTSTQLVTIERDHQRASEEILEALQPFGYYAPRVTSRLARLKKSKRLRATYEITLGPRTQVASVELNVSGAGGDQELLRLPIGKINALANRALDHRDYENAKRGLLTTIYDAGYLDVQYQRAQLLVDRTKGTAEIVLSLETGLRYEFGEVSIEQDILVDQFVAKYHNIVPGQPFDARRLVRLQSALNDTNYFDTVRLDIQRDQALNRQIPVVVQTTPRKKQKLSAGVGFGTDTGPRISAGIESRRVNRRGHSYRIDARASAISNALQAEYRIPIKDIAKDRWRIYARAEQSEIGDADVVQYAIGTAREDNWGVFRRRIFVNAERENFEFGDEPSQASTLVYPGITLSYDRLDNAEFVRRGFSLATTVQGGADALGSEVDFLTLRLSGRAVLPLGSKMRLLTGVELAHVKTDEFSRLPPSQRFYAGGDRSVRGYGFESISPENVNGDDIGGAYLASASLEVDRQLTDTWGLAAFVDAGQASADVPDNFSMGVGLGLRYRSPVGMIRFDLAHPLDDPDTSVRIHISIGPDL